MERGMSLSLLYVGPALRRISAEEQGAHVEQSVCKARGGSALLKGARSPGRWDPACRCGWRNHSNENKTEAVRSWRDHRNCAVWEARRIANGQPIYRVVEGYHAEDLRSEWRGFDTALECVERAGQLIGSGYTRRERFTQAQRSTDGQTWEAMA
jgi:hypothetical protein